MYSTLDDFDHEFYRKAKVLYDISRYQEVVSLLGPHLLEIFDSYMFFDALYKLEQYDELLHLSQDIGPENCRHVEILHLRAISFNNLRNFESAQNEIVQAISLAPDDAWGHHIFAHVTYNLGDYTSAHHSIMLAISIAPEIACFHTLRANICYGLRQFKQAKLALEDAVRIDPENDDALFELSLFTVSRAKKLELLQSALRNNPSKPSHQVHYSAIYHAFPWWLQPRKYPILIAPSFQIMLTFSCFAFAFFHPVLTQSIENIYDPVYIHHALYILAFGLVINNLWLSELLLVLCVLLFSRQIFCVDSPLLGIHATAALVHPCTSPSQISLFLFQLIGSVLLLPFVKPIFFNLRESYLEFLRCLQLLSKNDSLFKSLCAFLAQQFSAIIPWITAISFLIGITNNFDLLIMVGCWPLILTLYMPIIILLTIPQDKSLQLWLTEICTLVFPWLSVCVVYYLQLSFCSLLLTVPAIACLNIPLSIALGFIVSKSTIRFIHLVSD